MSNGGAGKCEHDTASRELTGRAGAGTRTRYTRGASTDLRAEGRGISEGDRDAE